VFQPLEVNSRKNGPISGAAVPKEANGGNQEWKLRVPFRFASVRQNGAPKPLSGRQMSGRKQVKKVELINWTASFLASESCTSPAKSWR
jgi:hypothetical protein